MQFPSIKFKTQNYLDCLIRPAKIEDAETIADINASVFGRVTLSLRKIKRQINKPKKYVWLVAELNHTIVGFQGIEVKRKHTFHLISLGVLNTYQHQGIGQALFNNCEYYARINHAKQLVLEVRQSNTAQKLYFNNNYLVTGFKHFYYVKPLENAVIMTKTIKY